MFLGKSIQCAQTISIFCFISGSTFLVRLETIFLAKKTDMPLYYFLLQTVPIAIFFLKDHTLKVTFSVKIA